MMFMPSHREGYGMPVLEAGLVGVPVVTADVPAAGEIGGQDVLRIDTKSPGRVADQIIAWANKSQTYQLRKRIRQEYTWQKIFRNHIEPLLVGGLES
jgi:glycosyltransferase involved in cell wall biosynthesis